MTEGDADWFERVVLDPRLSEPEPAEGSGIATGQGGGQEHGVDGRDPGDSVAAVSPSGDADGSEPTEELPLLEAAPDDEHWADFGEIVDTSEVSFDEMTGIWLVTEPGRESPLRMDGQPIEPEELDLPPAVCDRLRDWADQWRADWDPERGWLPRARIGDYEALGAWLARRVKDHVGAVDVTLYLVDQGRAGVSRIAAPGRREPLLVTLTSRSGAGLPVVGDFVTESGVGSFSAELNGRLEAWAADVADELGTTGAWQDPVVAGEYADYARMLAEDMTVELGPDYRVALDLWE